MTFLNVHYVLGMDKNLLCISEIMKHNPHSRVIFNNHKCYFVDKVNKKTLFVGIEEHGFSNWLM
jgi:hypothetical protein